MIKWIKNQYYMYLNKLHTDAIKALYNARKNGDISNICYTKESMLYQQKIKDNLNKIML